MGPDPLQSSDPFGNFCEREGIHIYNPCLEDASGTPLTCMILPNCVVSFYLISTHLFNHCMLTQPVIILLSYHNAFLLGKISGGLSFDLGEEAIKAALKKVAPPPSFNYL